MVTDFAVRLDSQRTSCWRSVLAALISFALVLSFFHCCCVDGDEETLTVSVAQTSCEVSGKAAPPAPHCCHCLAHAATVAPQDSAVAIEYVVGSYRLAAAPLPEAADLTSPFEPPRA